MLKFLKRILNNPNIIQCRKKGTIYALSSGKSKSGVAVIRTSGEASHQVFSKMLNLKPLPVARTALLRKIYDPTTQEMLDRGLVLWFPAPASFTGEDVCELHVHGGVAVVTAVLNALGKLTSFRPAEPGEFTRRAFLGHKLDLLEVEGLADLIDAETEFQRKQALIQTEGVLSRLYLKWRDLIVFNLAQIEAVIDFEETEDLDQNLWKKMVDNISQLQRDIQEHLQDGRRGERLRSGVKTVIVGKPNVGKSTLLNLLCNRPAAIVTPIAGTTRDSLEIALNIDGYPVLLVDTAGLNKFTSDPIEQEGINRTMKHSQTAELNLIVLDVNEILTQAKLPNFNLSSYLQDCLSEMKLDHVSIDNNLIVINKIDTIDVNARKVLDELIRNHSINVTCISCMTQEGLQVFVKKLSQCLENLCGLPSTEHPMFSQIRHRTHLEKCEQKLSQFLNSIQMSQYDLALVAEYLRSSLFHLGSISGAVTSEQLLDVIFKEFCIGK